MSGSITPLTITVNPYAASSHGGSRCANVPQARIEHTHVSRVVKDTQASEHLAHDDAMCFRRRACPHAALLEIAGCTRTAANVVNHLLAHLAV